MAQSIKTQTSQRLYLSPQQYLISTMIESTTDELVQLINRETEKNVSLEAEDPREVSLDGTPTSSNESDEGDEGEAISDVASKDDLPPASDADPVSLFDYDDDSASDRMGTRNPDDDDFTPGQNAVSEDSFREDLKRQIDELEISAEEAYLAYYLIDSLDEDGYLRRPLLELVDDLEFTQHHTTTEEDLEAVLVEIVQEELDPSGIGARDLRECMLLQLQEKKGAVARLAYYIVDKAFQHIVENRWDRIEQDFGITNHQAIVDIRRMIRHLNPKPGNMQPVTGRSTSARIQQVQPDFTVRIEDGQLVVWLNDGQVPQVRISADSEQDLERLQRQADEKQQEGNKAGAAEKLEGARFLREAIQSGRNFIDALNQRRNTMIEVMQTLVKMQRAYFLTGLDETLIPMTIEEVAKQCSYDISTISRVTNSKYVDTEFGVISLRDLFTNEVAGSNQTVVINVLRQVIEEEDKQNPLNDEALAAEVTRRGYKIARRTALKYREMLGIPVARLRKEV